MNQKVLGMRFPKFRFLKILTYYGLQRARCHLHKSRYNGEGCFDEDIVLQWLDNSLMLLLHRIMKKVLSHTFTVKDTMSKFRAHLTDKQYLGVYYLCIYGGRCLLDQRFIKNVLTGNFLLILYHFCSRSMKSNLVIMHIWAKTYGMVKLKAKIALSDKWSHFKLTSGLCILVHFISNVRFIIKYAMPNIYGKASSIFL